MICLDELLYGNPTWEQVVEFWKNEDFCDEGYLVMAIKRWLQTEEQRQVRAKYDISIEEMLNGRYDGREEITSAVQKIYTEWNKKLGFREFGY